MESAQTPIRYKYEGLSDQEVFDRLKHQAAQWFTNDNILLLEELFRRYNKCRASPSTNPTTTSSSS